MTAALRARTQRARMTARDIVVDGIPLHVVEAGDGPGLLLVHGASASHHVWEKTIPAFAHRWRVVAPDLEAFERFIVRDLLKTPGVKDVRSHFVLNSVKDQANLPLTYADQLAYARWLADEAHARGLAIGLKNAPDMVADSLEFFDFAITEDAFYYNWIEEMLPFVEAGKAVFAAEYTDMPVDFAAACEWGQAHNVSFILKPRILTAWRQTCP